MTLLSPTNQHTQSAFDIDNGWESTAPIEDEFQYHGGVWRMFPDWKIEYFHRDHPGAPFPQCGTLAAEEAGRFRDRLLSRLRLETADDKALAYALRDACSILVPGNAELPGFSLEPLLSNLGTSGDDKLIVWSLNWEDLAEAIAFKHSDLVEVFDYVWYPSSEDVFILPEDAQSMVWVDHGGYLYQSA